LCACDIIKEKKEVIIMDWTQFGLMLTAFVGLFIWNRTESRTDMRHMDAKLESNRNLILAIHEEIKDFHGRLCSLEERKK
jgi:hypothetical protein